jgi:hypothetical protein
MPAWSRCGARDARRINRAGPEGLKPLFDWVAHYEKFWRGREAKLKAVLEGLDE